MASAHREEIWVPGMPEPISHFVHVVRAGRMVFVSGCVATGVVDNLDLVQIKIHERML